MDLGGLFLQYVRALKESQCKWFLYENNYSIHKDIKRFITQQLGVEPVMINSKYFSAQDRKRMYWTNIPFVQELSNSQLKAIDIIDNFGYDSFPINTYPDGKYHLIVATYGNICDKIFTPMNSEVTKPRVAIRVKTENNKCVEDLSIFNIGNKNYRVYRVENNSVKVFKNGIFEIELDKTKLNMPNGDYILRQLTPVEAERLQTLPDNYTEGISNTQRYKRIGNGWTIKVITHILKGLIK